MSVWCTDQAGPFQTIPQAGESWQTQGKPACQPHEYFRDGTAKILTLFHPADGQVRVEGTLCCTNEILHDWLKQELTGILETLPAPSEPNDPALSRPLYERWQADLTQKPPLPDVLPALRMLLILDNLVGHKNPEFVFWLLTHGIMPLYTPLGGSWLNMAESIQRILKRRAMNGQHPTHTDQIIAWFEAVAAHWNREPTPFVWGGKRLERRLRQRERRHRLGGSAAYTRSPVHRCSPIHYTHEQGK